MIKYKLQFSNNIGEDYLAVFNQREFTGTPIMLTGTEGVLNIKSINNDDDRFSPILSKECEIKTFINTSQNISIADFIATEDDEWSITVTREPLGELIFQGFLVVEDSSQPLYDRPYPLTIRASDGLPLLKNVALKRYDATPFVKLNSLADYIGNILYYINPSIHFCIFFDIWHASMNTAHPLTQMQVDAKTFEEDETTFQNAYTVLESILLSTGCRLFYENGKWHIVSIWQYHLPNFNYSEFSLVAGVATQVDADAPQLIAEVGKTKDIRLVNKDAIIYYKTAAKSVKKTFNYETPKEIVCNQQLQRGAAIQTVHADAVFDGGGHVVTYAYQGYDLECLEHVKNGTGAITGFIAPTHQGYIKREYDEFNYEKDRYIVLPTESSSAGTAFIRTEPFYVSAGDKVNMSIETRAKNGYTGSGNSIWFYALLRGDNGVNYYLGKIGGADIAWHVSNSDFTSNIQTVVHSYAATDDRGEWHTLAVESPKIPVNGSLQFLFMEDSFANYPNETWIKSIQVDYLAFIKNSYRPVLGDYNIYSINKRRDKTIDETVFISDSPKKLIKGSLFVNGQLATPEWHRAGITESLRFMQIMTLVEYDYNFRQFHKVEGTLKGLSLRNASDENIPFGFLPQYSLTDTSTASKYMLTSMDTNYHSGQWRGVLVEVQPGSTAFDTYDFQYIFK